jgi:hypothetical protein
MVEVGQELREIAFKIWNAFVVKKKEGEDFGRVHVANSDGLATRVRADERNSYTVHWRRRQICVCLHLQLPPSAQDYGKAPSEVTRCLNVEKLRSKRLWIDGYKISIWKICLVGKSSEFVIYVTNWYFDHHLVYSRILHIFQRVCRRWWKLWGSRRWESWKKQR